MKHSLGLALVLLVPACSSNDDSNTIDQDTAALTGRVTLVATHSKKCVDVQGAQSANGTAVQQWDCVGVSNQQFELRDLGGGAVQIVAAHSGKCLDVFQAHFENGTPIVQWECNATYPNQRFELVPAPDGTVQIRSTFTKKCIDVFQANQANGTKVIQWECVAAYPNQRFTVKTSAPTPAPTTTSAPTTTTTTPPPPPPPTSPGIPTATSVGFKGDASTLKKTFPAGTSYDASNGTVFVSQDGLVLDGYDFRDKNVIVRANNVTIRNSLFSTGGFWNVLQDTGRSGLTVEDSTFDGLKRNVNLAATIWSYTGSTTIRRNKFVNLPTDSLNIRGGLVEYNYFEGSSYAVGAHADAIYVPSTSAPVEIRFNYVDWRTQPDAPQGTNNCVRVTLEGGGIVDNVNIHDNVFRGGNGYTLSVDDRSRHVVIQNNRLEDTTVYGAGSFYFYPSYPPDIVFTGNTDYLTGAPVSMR